MPFIEFLFIKYIHSRNSSYTEYQLHVTLCRGLVTMYTICSNVQISVYCSQSLYEFHLGHILTAKHPWTQLKDVCNCNAARLLETGKMFLHIWMSLHLALGKNQL
jgi:hypothetical protein